MILCFYTFFLFMGNERFIKFHLTEVIQNVFICSFLETENVNHLCPSDHYNFRIFRMDRTSRMIRSTNSKSNEKCFRNSEELKKFDETRRAPAFLRACGCAHRFSPTSNENSKSLSGFKRRSKSCTPVRTHFRIESEGTGVKLPKKNDSLTRHISEDNLNFKHIMEIKEKLELLPLDDEEYGQLQKSEKAPRRYKTTICIDLDSSEQKYIEEVSFEVSPAKKQNDGITLPPMFTHTFEATIERTILTGDKMINRISKKPND